ncbi:hypothetical protein [Aeoliella sp.]|uniref:hypothetical protein n=1 Tax=Aeoliella sp. TaxID=2795800 RepID=UPI003CCBD6E9
MEISIAEHTSRLGLDDAFSDQLAMLLANCNDPLAALQRCRWTIPPQEELAAMDPEVCAVVLVPLVSTVISKLPFDLTRGKHAELVSEGCLALSQVAASLERGYEVHNIKNWAWKAVYRRISTRLDSLKTQQVIWNKRTGEPLNGHYMVESDGIYHPVPFTDWDGIYPALRSLYDCCQDDLDRALIKLRWADGRCITNGYLMPLGEIAERLSIDEPEVVERLHCLRNRWRCYINRTQRFTKHLPAKRSPTSESEHRDFITS